MTPSRYHRHQVQARAQDGVQSAIQPVSEVSLVGRSWAGVDSRNRQYANYPRRRCVISMWGSKSGPFPSSVSRAAPAEGSCPRQLQPRPMISFSRANHHARPGFSSHFRRAPPRGKSRMRSSASCPGLQMGNVGPKQILDPWIMVQRQTPDQPIKPFSPLPQQRRSKKIKKTKATSLPLRAFHMRRDRGPTQRRAGINARGSPALTNFRLLKTRTCGR